MHAQPCHRLLPMGCFHGHAAKIQKCSNTQLIGTWIYYTVHNGTLSLTDPWQCFNVVWYLSNAAYYGFFNWPLGENKVFSLICWLIDWLTAFDLSSLLLGFCQLNYWEHFEYLIIFHIPDQQGVWKWFNQTLWDYSQNNGEAGGWVAIINVICNE